MEYGEERAWWERVGDRTYEKEEWKKIPTERFQNYATMTMNLVSPDLSSEQMEWFYGHVYHIPSYETMNPFATVLGFCCIDWKTKQLTTRLFKKMTDKYAKKLQITPADVLRYARKWQTELS